MSGNVHSLQVGGFLQRIDYVRKYAFGVMCILKNSEGQFPIRGFWIFRGQDIPQMMKDECYDLELYNWEKLDGKALNAVSTLTLVTPRHTHRTALLILQVSPLTLLLLLELDPDCSWSCFASFVQVCHCELHMLVTFSCHATTVRS